MYKQLELNSKIAKIQKNLVKRQIILVQSRSNFVKSGSDVQI